MMLQDASKAINELLKIIENEKNPHSKIEDIFLTVKLNNEDE